MSISAPRTISFLAAALVVAAFVAGCGTAIDDTKIEADLEQYVEDRVGKKVASVDCPSGVEVEKGKTFACAVSLAGGKEETATVKILNEDADYELADLQPAK
jgi:NAD(P)H-hydrate repair Nnr-like enzyme with NAD(P)H-hydrate epimerase domain